MNTVRSHVTLATLLLATLSTGCLAMIQQDEVGVKNRFGKYDSQPVGPGLELYNPFSTSIERVKTRTVNVELAAQLPSKEGLTIDTDVSILYNVVPEAAPKVLGTIGQDYENTMIRSVFRSAAADVSARFFAKDMHSGMRSEIERAIREQMMTVIGPRGFVVERVLLKSISLPTGLARSIELKLQAEQDAQRMVFELERERQQAEQRKVNAEGIRAAQEIIAGGLSEQVLRFEAIKAFRDLALSPNAKVVLTDGKTPLMLQPSVPSTPEPARALTSVAKERQMIGAKAGTATLELAD
ncbi:MAG: prohibitin family protein [Kofleriaceae bacterium]|nr:prohibitin family protein [Kofleriaceae bacterium]